MEALDASEDEDSVVDSVEIVKTEASEGAEALDRR